MGSSQSLPESQCCSCTSSCDLPYSVYQAAVEGHWRIISNYLKEGNANASYKGWTLMHTACYHGREKVVAKLMEQKEVCVNLRTSSAETALMMAAQRGYIDCVQLLLSCEHKCSIEVDAVNSSGQTALDLAHINNFHDITFYMMSEQKKSEYPNETKPYGIKKSKDVELKLNH